MSARLAVSIETKLNRYIVSGVGSMLAPVVPACPRLLCVHGKEMGIISCSYVSADSKVCERERGGRDSIAALRAQHITVGS